MNHRTPSPKRNMGFGSPPFATFEERPIASFQRFERTGPPALYDAGSLESSKLVVKVVRATSRVGLLENTYVDLSLGYVAKQTPVAQGFTTAPVWNAEFPFIVDDRDALCMYLKINTVHGEQTVGSGAVGGLELKARRGKEIEIDLSDPNIAARHTCSLVLHITDTKTSVYSSIDPLLIPAPDTFAVPDGWRHQWQSPLDGPGLQGRESFLPQPVREPLPMRERQPSPVRKPPTSPTRRNQAMNPISGPLTVYDAAERPSTVRVPVCVLRGRGLSKRTKDSVQPYVILNVGFVSKKTATASGGSQPEWGETFAFAMEPDDTLQLSVQDNDPNYDEALGIACVQGRELVLQSGQEVSPPPLCPPVRVCVRAQDAPWYVEQSCGPPSAACGLGSAGPTLPMPMCRLLFCTPAFAQPFLQFWVPLSDSSGTKAAGCLLLAVGHAGRNQVPHTQDVRYPEPPYRQDSRPGYRRPEYTTGHHLSCPHTPCPKSFASLVHCT